MAHPKRKSLKQGEIKEEPTIKLVKKQLKPVRNRRITFISSCS